MKQEEATPEERAESRRELKRLRKLRIANEQEYAETVCGSDVSCCLSDVVVYTESVKFVSPFPQHPYSKPPAAVT